MRAQEPQRLNQIFHALADTSRRGMIDRLSQGPASVSELARPLGMALPSVVKHLAVLEAGGLVSSEKAGRVRTYRMTPDALSAIETWLAARKARWLAQSDQLDELLAEQKPRARRGRR